MSRPPTEVELAWQGGERFGGRVGQVPVVVDGDDADTLSPVQALALGLAACMSIDVATILEKGRQPLRGIDVKLVGRRAEEPPRRFLGFVIHYRVTGAVEPARVERAIALSRQTYCSVWHSLREDITLETSYAIEP